MIFKCVICSQDFNQKDHLDVAKAHPELRVCKNCRIQFGKYFTNCTKCNTPFFHNSPKQNICSTCSVDILYLDCVVCGETYRIRYSNQVLCSRCSKINHRLSTQRHIIEYNKSEIGRKKSAEVGKRTIKYAIKAQQEKNGVRFCEKCNKETMHVCGVGCLTCHNRSEIMRRATSNRNYYNWANDEEYRKRIASNLGDYLKGAEALSKDEILKRINTLVKNCRNKDFAKLKDKLRKWKNADEECYKELERLIKEINLESSKSIPKNKIIDEIEDSTNSNQSPPEFKTRISRLKNNNEERSEKLENLPGKIGSYESPSGIPKDVILKEIEDFDNSNNNFFRFKYRVSKLKNADEECLKKLEELEKEIGLKSTNAIPKSQILKEIEDFVNSNQSFFKFKDRITKLKNADEECLNSLIALAKEAGIPTTRREAFYQSHVKLTSYNSLDEMIKDFDALIGIPGVWEVRGSDGITYDVCQTKDIGTEMYEYLRRLEFNKGLTDEEIDFENLRYYYNRKKYKNIMDDVSSVDFVLIIRDVDSQEERELVEAQRAIDTEAAYWSPAPTQIGLLKIMELY